MLITISGAQGQGKTTVLNALAELGYTVIPKKTSRSILADWGMSLHDVNKSHSLTYNFQEEIIERQYRKDSALLNSSEIYFSERSYADIFSYALNILGAFNEYDVWMNDYYRRCKEYQQAYDCVIYLSGREFYTPEDDGVRSINKQFAKMMDLTIRNFVTDFDNGNVVYIDTPSYDERIEAVLTSLKRLQSGK